MLSRFFAWPKLLGLLVGTLGTGVALTGASFAGRAHFLGDAVEATVWLAVGCLILVAGLSYPLYRGHEWARRALLAIVGLCAVSGLVLAIVRLSEGAIIDDRASVPAAWVVAESILRMVGFPLLLLSLPSFFILLLCHPDVVAAFRRDAALPLAPKA